MPPLCSACVHFRDQDDGKCAHPNVSVSLINGDRILRSAPRMREWDGPCGPEGRLWDSAAAERAVSAPHPESPLPGTQAE